MVIGQNPVAYFKTIIRCSPEESEKNALHNFNKDNEILTGHFKYRLSVDIWWRCWWIIIWKTIWNI